MKTNVICTAFHAALAICLCSSYLSAQEVSESEAPPATITSVIESTEMDNPGEFHSEFGMMPGSELEKSLRPIAKIDLDGDLDYDGAMSNTDSASQGAREYEIPGLQLGVGELTKLVVRFKTYEYDYPGEVYVTLQVDGIDRFSQAGTYGSDKEEADSVGRVKIWRDMERTELLVDSGDTSKKKFEWKVDKKTLKSGLPGGIPRVIYVEGVEASKKFEGDLRVLVYASQTFSESDVREPSGVYKTAFDHILFTVLEKPLEKEFVNNNVEGVWSSVKSRPASEPEKPEAAASTADSEPAPAEAQ